uniref:AMP-binding enzyme C-terminal domain-containing protein n=1 Tax=Haptolina ericina TaxID=156174 RepID=A0A7S3BB36_9EUKA
MWGISQDPASPLPAGIQAEAVGNKPGSTSLPMPGYDVRVFDADTKAELPTGKLGHLAIRLPLPPGTMRTIYNDDDRCRRSYFEDYPGFYSAGDAGFIDEDGYIHVMGRTDDVINCAGHRLSTGALEEVVASHPSVAECAVIGAADHLKGQVPVGLVVLTSDCDLESEEVARQLVARVRAEVGAVASFRQAAVVSSLPKTRSGKTLRGIMQSIADGRSYRIPGTIEDEAPLAAVTAALKALGYPKGGGTAAG